MHLRERTEDFRGGAIACRVCRSLMDFPAGQEYATQCCGYWYVARFGPLEVAIYSDVQPGELPEVPEVPAPAPPPPSRLGTPEEGTQATADYKAQIDMVGRFIEACCITGNPTQVKVKASRLYAAYKAWCGEDTLIQRAFGVCLTARGFQRYTNNGSWWRGIGLPAPTTERTE